LELVECYWQTWTNIEDSRANRQCFYERQFIVSCKRWYNITPPTFFRLLPNVQRFIFKVVINLFIVVLLTMISCKFKIIGLQYKAMWRQDNFYMCYFLL
jgi:hypothetical protein